LLCALLLFCVDAFLLRCFVASLLCCFTALLFHCFAVSLLRRFYCFVAFALLQCTVANILDYLLAYSLRIKAFDLSNYTQFFTKKP
jgi:hypothetical protein